MPLTKSEVLDRFYNLVAFQEDRAEGIHITTLVYDCIRRGYYSHKLKQGFFDLSTLLKFWVGRCIHKPALLKHNEQEFRVGNIVGTPDDFEDGTIVDKKHTASQIPSKPPAHYITQVEYYRWLLEKNGEKVKNGFILYIYVGQYPKAEVFEVKFRSRKDVEKEITMKVKLMETALDKGLLPKRTRTWLCGYCNFSSICYQDLDVADLSFTQVSIVAEAEFPSIEVPTWMELFGTRLESAKDMMASGIDYIKNLTVTGDPVEISAIVQGGTDEYSVFLGDTSFCACPDHQSKKVVCKHMLYTGLQAIARDKVSEAELMALLMKEVN